MTNHRKKPSRVEVLNDINGDIVNLYRVVKNHLDEFIRQFKWALISREMFEWEKMKTVEPLTDIQRAVRFFYLQKLCFGSVSTSRSYGVSTTTSPKINLLRIEEDLSNAHLRLARVNIERLDWLACIDKYDRSYTLFYMDPPYYGLAGYGVDFGVEQYQHMADKLKTMLGKAIVSINDCDEMRAVFSDFNITSVGIKYTVSKSKILKGKGQKELIICNF